MDRPNEQSPARAAATRPLARMYGAPTRRSRAGYIYGAPTRRSRAGYIYEALTRHSRPGYIYGPALIAILGLGSIGAGFVSRPWGERGHWISGDVAARTLPAGMPAFFREAAPRLAYLNAEPDRWRERSLREMNEAFAYDHYIDLERVPAGALGAADRFAFLGVLHAAGIQDPARSVGLLPFRIVELYERLLTEFRLWRRETDPAKRAWIEERIINDAGVIGHYASDAANPHHTTIHHNGWAEGVPNPEGFTTEQTFHGRFEGAFVGARVRSEDVQPRVPGEARVLTDPRREVLAFIRASHALVPALYRLEQQRRFDEANDSPAHKQFAVERLAAGADFLRNLWWTAWVESATEPERRRNPGA